MLSKKSLFYGSRRSYRKGAGQRVRSLRELGINGRYIQDCHQTSIDAEYRRAGTAQVCVNKPGAGVNDATIFSLGSTILPAVSHVDQANRLFVDHVTLAAGIHLASTYGGLRPVARPVRGGLAPWQERRAKEVLSSNLDGSEPLKDVARECRLSVSHFSRAFRRTIGVAPHNWLLMRRIEVAKEKLRNSRLPLAEVALACGFADQSHLTRVFTGMVGVSPSAWRRALDE